MSSFRLDVSGFVLRFGPRCLDGSLDGMAEGVVEPTGGAGVVDAVVMVGVLVGFGVTDAADGCD